MEGSASTADSEKQDAMFKGVIEKRHHEKQEKQEQQLRGEGEAAERRVKEQQQREQHEQDLAKSQPAVLSAPDRAPNEERMTSCGSVTICWIVIAGLASGTFFCFRCVDRCSCSDLVFRRSRNGGRRPRRRHR